MGAMSRICDGIMCFKIHVCGNTEAVFSRMARYAEGGKMVKQEEELLLLTIWKSLRDFADAMGVTLPRYKLEKLREEWSDTVRVAPSILTESALARLYYIKNDPATAAYSGTILVLPSLYLADYTIKSYAASHGVSLSDVESNIIRWLRARAYDLEPFIVKGYSADQLKSLSQNYVVYHELNSEVGLADTRWFTYSTDEILDDIMAGDITVAPKRSAEKSASDVVYDSNRIIQSGDIYEFRIQDLSLDGTQLVGSPSITIQKGSVADDFVMSEGFNAPSIVFESLTNFCFV